MKSNPHSPRKQRGVAVIVVLAMLGIISLYIAANLRSLSQIKTEVKKVERHQLKQLAAHPDVAAVSATLTAAPKQIAP